MTVFYDQDELIETETVVQKIGRLNRGIDALVEIELQRDAGSDVRAMTNNLAAIATMKDQIRALSHVPLLMVIDYE